MLTAAEIIFHQAMGKDRILRGKDFSFWGLLEHANSASLWKVKEDLHSISDFPFSSSNPKITARIF